MLNNIQLLLLLRAQQSSGRKRVRYLKNTKPTYYSEEIEELIDRFELELPETIDFFVNTPAEAIKQPLAPSEELSVTATAKILNQSLVGVITELTKALVEAEQVEKENKEKEQTAKAIKTILELVQKTKKKIKEEEELLFILMEM